MNECNLRSQLPALCQSRRHQAKQHRYRSSTYALQNMYHHTHSDVVIDAAAFVGVVSDAVMLVVLVSGERAIAVDSSSVVKD